MKRLLLITALLCLSGMVFAQNTAALSASEKLVAVWSSADREVALKMLFMYVSNSRKYDWWRDITLAVWGPSAKLLSEDKELQSTSKTSRRPGSI